MQSKQSICSTCSQKLGPDVSICPHCGARQEPAWGSRSSQASSNTEAEQPQKKQEQEARPVIPTKRQPLSHSQPSLYPADLVYLAPPNDLPRFSRLTPYQLTLLAAGLALVFLISVVGYLLWRQQTREEENLAHQLALIQPSPSPTLAVDLPPTPALLDDQAIAQAVKSALMEYNPQGVARYQFEVKDGIVTLSGEAENQAEKDGAENVIRALAGVKWVINNLSVKAEPQTVPVKLNEVEAKRLEEALRQQLLEEQQHREEEQRHQAELEAQREAERQRRELALAQQRAEEAALRKAAEEQLQREAAEAERRWEERRRLEAERRARAEQARLQASTLPTGTVAWSGIVDGVVEVLFSGSSASVRHLSGGPPREVQASFSAPIPRSPVNVKLLSASGRGSINIVQEPSAANGYTTIVRIDDSSKNGSKRYEFTLRWLVPE
jgi:hypothetical protein